MTQESLGLGRIIPEGASVERDAIHIAVVPVKAGAKLAPGTKVKLQNTVDPIVVAAGKRHPSVGVIDPYLDAPVQAGQQCWLYLNPGSITSLRHAWSHPAFPMAMVLTDAERAKSEQVTNMLLGDRQKSIDFMTELASDLGMSFEAFMSQLEECLESGDSFSTGDNQVDVPDDMWKHYEVITGKQLEEKVRENFWFSCAC